MKARCINNKWLEDYFTIDKIYEVEDAHTYNTHIPLYKLITDKDTIGFGAKYRFVLLEDAITYDHQEYLDLNFEAEN